MNDILSMAWGTGLIDGLNPCMMISCAVFIGTDLWLNTKFLRSGFWRILFALCYILGFWAFSFGPGQTWVIGKSFIITAKIVYFILGAWGLWAGISFLHDWSLIRKGTWTESKKIDKIKLSFVSGFSLSLLTVFLAVILSALSTYWPLDKYFYLLANEKLFKGMWQFELFSTVNYVLASMWPLWLIWGFLSIKNVRLSLFKIFCSAIFLTSSTSLFLIFK